MQHSEAIEMMAAEKYVLKDLTPELKDAFEEHFFDCQECALDVRLADAFVEHSKLVLDGASDGQPVKRVNPAREGWITRRWRPAFAVLVMAGLLIAVLYQGFVTNPRLHQEIASAKEPQVLPHIYLSGPSRGRLPVVQAKSNRPFLVLLDIPGKSNYTSYVCELIYSPDKQVVWSLPVSAEAAKNSVPLLISPKSGKPGVYQLIVHANTSDEQGARTIDLEPYSFELRIQQ